MQSPDIATSKLLFVKLEEEERTGTHMTMLDQRDIDKFGSLNLDGSIMHVDFAESDDSQVNLRQSKSQVDL